MRITKYVVLAALLGTMSSSEVKAIMINKHDPTPANATAPAKALAKKSEHESEAESESESDFEDETKTPGVREKKF